MNEWTQDKNIVIVHYPGYAGGKFIINCLGFNERCYPSILSNDLTYADKIPKLFATIPPSHEECKNWLNYELSCGSFWPDRLNNIDFNQEIRLSDHARQTLNSKYCFMVTHGSMDLHRIKTQFPNAKHLELVNYDKFIEIAMTIKTGSYEPLAYKPPPRGDFLFDIDSNIFDWDNFYPELVRCCQWLGIPPNFDPRLKEFYTAYMTLHTMP